MVLRQTTERTAIPEDKLSWRIKSFLLLFATQE